jgi:hypothetical protein
MSKQHISNTLETHAIPRQRVACVLGKHEAALRNSCMYGRKRGTAANTDSQTSRYRRFSIQSLCREHFRTFETVESALKTVGSYFQNVGSYF